MQEASIWREKFADFAASRIALFGLALFVLIVLAALGAPWLSMQNPYD